MMAKRTAYRQTGVAGEVQCNMTPMIDCTFQLIIFFILAGQMASKELAPLKLHRPEASQSIPTEKSQSPDRVIVNVLSSAGLAEDANPALAGRAERYEIDGNRLPVGNIERLTEMLRSRKQASANKQKFYIEIRADYRVNFGDVEPVMLAAAEAEIVNMNLTALTAVGD